MPPPGSHTSRMPRTAVTRTAALTRRVAPPRCHLLRSCGQPVIQNMESAADTIGVQCDHSTRPSPCPSRWRCSGADVARSETSGVRCAEAVPRCRPSACRPICLSALSPHSHGRSFAQAVDESRAARSVTVSRFAGVPTGAVCGGAGRAPRATHCSTTSAVWHRGDAAVVTGEGISRPPPMGAVCESAQDESSAFPLLNKVDPRAGAGLDEAVAVPHPASASNTAPLDECVATDARHGDD
ncbi:hypothetical protein QE410_003300 [Microbacterium sp. SORGH_AS 1204]|nr:hypothetical protein [Microbacterium sp. SORGH_AS_1204]